MLSSCLWVSSALEVAGRVLARTLLGVLVLDLLELLVLTSENNLLAKLFFAGSPVRHFEEQRALGGRRQFS